MPVRLPKMTKGMLGGMTGPIVLVAAVTAAVKGRSYPAWIIASPAEGRLAAGAGTEITLTLSASLFLVSLVVINLKSPAVRRLA